MTTRMTPFIGLGLSIVLSLTLGLLLGGVFTFGAVETPITQVPDTRSGVPVVTLHGMRNGALEGSLTGDARVFLGDEQVSPDADGNFRIASRLVTANEIDVIVPDGMLFVASRRGKKYYSVTSAGGQNLTPQNRVYFRSAEQAEAAGYRP